MCFPTTRHRWEAADPDCATGLRQKRWQSGPPRGGIQGAVAAMMVSLAGEGRMPREHGGGLTPYGPRGETCTRSLSHKASSPIKGSGSEVHRGSDPHGIGETQRGS